MRANTRPTLTVLLAAALVASAAATAAPPKRLLDGQTLDFIPAENGDDDDAVRLTILTARLPHTEAVDMRSDEGKDIIGFVRAIGATLASTDILPKSPRPGPPRESFTLALKEHVVYRMGDNVGPALAAGFTFGLAAPSTTPITYVTEMTLGATRTDGLKSEWRCEARVKGSEPRNGRPAPAMWLKMYGEARDNCLSELLAEMKADRDFFR